MKTSIIRNKKFIKRTIIVLIWLTIWEMVSLFVSNDILLVGPVDVLRTLAMKLWEVEFYKSIGLSVLRIVGGFLIGSLVGGLLAICSWKSHFIEDFCKPFMSFVKAAPIASFVVLFLIWWHSNILSIAICICVSLPQIYVNMLMALKNADKKMLEMAEVFQLPIIDKINYVYRPSVCNYMESAVRLAVGMAFKAGIAAEVIGTPDNSIGNGLYMSKIYLDTAGVLSWTVVIILLSVVWEQIILMALRTYSRYEFKCQGSKLNIQSENNKKIDKLALNGIKKSYGEKLVLDNYSNEFITGEVYSYDWISGAGKTTLFRIIAGLEKCDLGEIHPNKYSVSIAFQDDRLVDGFSAIRNITLIMGDRNKTKAKELLLNILEEDDISKPVEQLSGGQRRRVAIIRALAVDADVAIFDEPYESLDIAVRDKVSQLIREYGKDKITLIASHI